MRPIDADALKSVFTEKSTEAVCGAELCKAIISRICDAPTVDAVPVRQGKWIYSNDFHWYTASCNKCGYQRRTDIKAEGWNQWKFCPNCGARMDEEDDDETN